MRLTHKIRSFFCFLGCHYWEPSRGFVSRLTDPFFGIEVKVESWVGLECVHCGSRRLLQKSMKSSIEATQSAYNWVHFRDEITHLNRCYYLEAGKNVHT